ncbi:transcription factor bHLH111 isoform X2 [Magnolia sinica]|uniref:transcription factor bHLH111 isoform X2 n=1 Tax=Magnolia sinica TaxID=86752 RepID=UPI002657FED6|nr:transcription factor bHLH111 isoform X2 [Magnolia sinica]
MIGAFCDRSFLCLYEFQRSVGTGGDLNNGHDDGENFLKALSSKNLTMDLFEPDLKKFDNCWEFTNPASFNSMEKQLNGYDGSLIEHERLTHLSDLVSNWSIAPPDPQLDRQIAPATCNISLNSSMDLYLESSSSLPQLKQEPQNPSLYLSNGGLGNRNSGYMPCYGHDVKVESQHHGMEASEGAFLRPFNGNGTGYQMGHANSVVGDNSKYYYGMLDVPWSNPRAFSDYISFSGCLNKPLVDFHASKPCIKGSNSPDGKKQGHETSSSARGNGRGSGISSEGKKKRSEDNSDTTVFKKPKNENSTVSSLKIQAPKVKLGDRITALQQIVSPFGKTDTASVLLEAIGYIKFLQEQVQLLSNPYMKANANKDHSPWGGLERKDKSEPKYDLKSRGLCLVPISCTPQVYRENTGSDYWTPTYRGCLYR